MVRNAKAIYKITATPTSSGIQIEFELNIYAHNTRIKSNDSLESNDTRLSSFQHFVVVVPVTTQLSVE